MIACSSHLSHFRGLLFESSCTPLSEMKLTLELLATLRGSVKRRRVIKGVTKRLFRNQLDL